MPYKERDAFHRALRAYLKDVAPTVAERTVYHYKDWIERVGKLTGYKDPRRVTLRDMVLLESKARWGETTTALRLAMYRAFLRWIGNRDALKWKIQAKQRPKLDGIFLSSGQIAACQAAAHRLGVEHELILSLAVDNGLRPIDMQRLTVRNAEQLVSAGQSVIRSKGRRGGKMRLLVMSMRTVPILEEYLRTREDLVLRYRRNPPLLLIRVDRPKRTVVPMTYDVVSKRIEHIVKASGVFFRPHDGRRTFGHRHYLEGTKIETTAALMGHERIDTTFRSYIGISVQEMRDAQDRLCPSPPIQSVRTV